MGNRDSSETGYISMGHMTDSAVTGFATINSSAGVHLFQT